jgi:TPP-dependent pyruvate/acetoin dehydrogenase alpha subunit
MEVVRESKNEEIKKELQEELNAAEQFAIESPFPDVSELMEDVYF